MQLSTKIGLPRATSVAPPPFDDLVIDVGLHTGEDTAYYLHRGYRVVAIDANPVMIRLAEQRFKREIATGRLSLLNLGVFTSSGEFDFWISSHDDWSSFDQKNASKLHSHSYPIRIPCVPFEDILGSYGVPVYLKIDIEKLDSACLRSLTPSLRPRYLSWEASIHSADDLLAMRNIGYNAFKCIDQMTLKSSLLEVGPRSAIHALRRTLGKLQRRKHGNWVFQSGLSSGPFGEETDGPWRSFDEICQAFESFCRENPDDERWPSWFDFHATTKLL